MSNEVKHSSELEESVENNFIYTKNNGVVIVKKTISEIIEFLMRNKVAFSVSYDLHSEGEDELNPVVSITNSNFNPTLQMLRREGINHEIMI